MNPDTTTILDPLRAHTEKHADKLLYAFLDVQGQTTQSYRYETFWQRTTDIASHIYRSNPLAPGERVLLVYPPGVEMICAFFACVRLGLIPVPVYPPSSQGFASALYKMDFIAQDCGAAAVLTDRTYFWSMKLHRTRTNISAFSLKRGYTSKLEWIVTSDAEPCVHRDFPETHSETLFLQYTSGSTRDPKGVIVTHRNILSNCGAVVDHLPVTVSWLPQYHDMGLIAFYLFMAVSGGTTYGFSPIDFIQRPLLWFETISKYRATASAGPNFAYGYCLRPDKIDDASLEHVDLSSLQILLNGAEPVKADVFREFLNRFERYGLRPSSFSAAYGLAEYTLAVTGRGRATYSIDAEALTRNEVSASEPSAPSEETTTLVSCGAPLGATDVKIVEVSDDAREVPVGRVGEVWVTGPSKCSGYWGRPELTKEVFEATIDGDDDPARTWLRTGDLGFMKDGELYICGRAKDLIIVRGANYYPQDIEAIVEEDPAIRKGCVAAFAADQNGSEHIVVVAELKNGKRHPDTEGVARSVQQRLGIAVDSFVYIPKRTIPKTSSGKISRHQALARWQDDQFEVVHRVEIAGPPLAGIDVASEGEAVSEGEQDAGTPASLDDLLRRYGLTGAESQTLNEVGLDSLGMVEFSLALERHLEARGASDLAAGVDLRWLQKIAISELFELIGQVDLATPHAKLHFRQAFTKLLHEHQEIEHDLMRRDAQFVYDRSDLSGAETDTEQAHDGILLTGGTGFFGPFLLWSLLEQCEGPIYVLVRARDADHGRERLGEGLALLGMPMTSGPLADWQSRVIPICGDLTQPRMGVTKADWTLLSERTHTVYHNGALVNYLFDYATMRDANVTATKEVIRLASTHRAKCVNHISTTFVFGWSTKETLFETDNNQGMDLLDFGYSQSKWVSEQIVLSAVEQGLSARIFRPALIVPSEGGGGYNFDISIRLLAFMIKHGISTTAQNQVSFSPADLLANNIVAIANLPDTVGKTFHVTRDNYSSMLEITNLLGELTQTEFTDYAIEDFVPTIIERCQTDDLLFPLLNFLVRSVDNITAMEFKRYDSSDYQEARARSPFGVPDPPLEDVVSGIVRFMARHDIINGRKAELVSESIDEEAREVARR
jgi:thioester reductase-like protein